MSIASEIQRIKSNIASAYTTISNKGGTLPTTQNSANLPQTIANIPAGSSDYLKITKTFQNIEASCYIYKPSYTAQALTEAERILNSDDMLIPLLFELAQTDPNTLAENIVNMGVELIEKLLQLSTVVQDYYLASDASEAYGLTNPLRLVLYPVSDNSFSIYNFIGLFMATITIEEDTQTGEKSSEVTNITQYIAPTGTKQISITQNGTTTEDVTNYANAQITTNVVNQDYEDALVAFGVTEDLADSIEALTTYSNEVTGESDTTLSDAVRTLTDGYDKIIALTQAEYDALVTKDANTVYVIVGV